MSTETLEGLLSYLYGTLSTSDMRWMASRLNSYADQEEKAYLKPMTMEEINARLDQAEREIEAGLGIPDEEVWDELEEMEREEKEALEMAEAV